MSRTGAGRTSGEPACAAWTPYRQLQGADVGLGGVALESGAVDLEGGLPGSAGAPPDAERALAATLVRRGGERLLFDCSEGTQRQLLRSDVGLVELEEIFLTHYHADHYLGLPGMLKTYSLRGRDVPLTICGPGGLR